MHATTLCQVQPRFGANGWFRKTATTPRGVSRIHLRCNAANTAYEPPSRATAASELEALSRWTTIVPDSVLLETESLKNLKAATVSYAVLSGILGGPTSNPELETAVWRAITYDKCATLTGQDQLRCRLDKALANVGAAYAGKVEGRISTEIDPRLAYDAPKLVEKAKHLVELYKEMDVPLDKLLMRLPATWEGIQAARQLEEDGIATHLVFVASFIQAAAAAQAGVSVIQPNLGRIEDWYAKHPGFIRDPLGPREDTGFASGTNPAVQLVKKIYNYCQKYHPKTCVMASGIRKSEEALELAGLDYIVLGHRVLRALLEAPTMQGYNDGLSAASPADDDGVPCQLSPESAREAEFSEAEAAPVTEALFREQLGPVGQELLDAGLVGLIDTVNRFEPAFDSMVVGTE